MIDKKNLIKMAKAIVRHDNGYPDKRLMHPQREWFIGLVLFVVVVLIGSFFAGNIFITYQNIDTSKGDSGKSIPVYRQTIITDALDRYKTHTKEYEQLRAVVATVHDTNGAASSTEEISVKNNKPATTTSSSEDISKTKNLGEIELSF